MNDYLQHHGIVGQKWYIRRFQNPDGTLTPAGKKRYNVAEKRLTKRDEYVNEKIKAPKLASERGGLSTMLRTGAIANDAQRVHNLHDTVRKDQRSMLELGERTMEQRVSTITAGSLVAAGSAFAAASLTGTLLFGAIPAALVAAGTAYCYHLTTR